MRTKRRPRYLRAFLSTSALILLCSLIVPVSAFANRQCTEAEKKTADKWLHLNARDQKLAREKHLPWGAPARAEAAEGERVLIHSDYIIGYHDELRVPLWTAYRLDAAGLNKVDGRVECFRADVRIPAAAQSTPDDYEEPKFDQGHLAPSEDMSHNTRQNVNSFIMSNMAPQYGSFNRVIWRRLEGQGQKWAKAFRTVYVVSGSIFDKDGDGKPDDPSEAPWMKSNNEKKRVAIPTHFFKIIARDCGNGRIESLAFVLPHENKSRTGQAAIKFLSDNIVTIASIEEVSGVSLFPHASGEGKVERTTMWPLTLTTKSAPACGE